MIPELRPATRALLLLGENPAHYPLADGALLAEHSPPAEFARLFIVFVLSQFLFQTAPLEQLLEPPKGRANRLTIVNTHPDRHTYIHSKRPCLRGGTMPM